MLNAFSVSPPALAMRDFEIFSLKSTGSPADPGDRFPIETGFLPVEVN